MSALSHAKITLRRSKARGHADHGWLDTYHTFSFASYHDPHHSSFGSIRVLNEDRVAPGTGFPTHPHRDAEIFSYILRGELTHRDSMIVKGSESKAAPSKADFYRMRRGDVQFTTGGSGIAHSETNEHASEWVHFLQIWVTPWARGLHPRYHTQSFDDTAKKERFVPILSPLKAGPEALASDETEAIPAVPSTIPIHADLLFAAGIIDAGSVFEWGVGGSELDAAETTSDAVVRKTSSRRVYVHVTMTSEGKSQIRINNSDELGEGDGCYIENVAKGDLLRVESIGSAAAEVVILDSD